MQITKTAAAMLLTIAALPAAAQDKAELTVRPGEPVAATIEGKPARLLIRSGAVNRLTLEPEYVAQHGIKPAPIMGKAELSVAGRREFRGHNRPLDFAIAGVAAKARAFWFEGAPASPADGAIGPMGVPQPRVTFVLAAAGAGETVSRAPLLGNQNSSSMSGYREASFGMLLTFDMDSAERFPVATAAAGAAIAKAYGGTLSGASWDVDILMGVHRPVRLMTLARPLVIGPMRFDRIAVRVRDRIDDGGRGEAIPEAGAVDDPDEIVVQGRRKGAAPGFGMTIPRAGLAGCSRLTFDKAAKVVEMLCR